MSTSESPKPVDYVTMAKGKLQYGEIILDYLSRSKIIMTVLIRGRQEGQGQEVNVIMKTDVGVMWL